MSFSFARAALPLSALLLLATSGCFRQTGEIIEPTSTADGQIAVTRAPDTVGVFVPEATTAPGPAGTIVPVDAAPTPEGADVLSVATMTPESTIALVIVTSTPQYITPQIPLGFTTPDTPAPTVAPVAETTGIPRTAGQPNFILPDSSNILATPTNLPGVDDECVHVVQAGDSLYLIAITYGFTVDEILAANPDLEDASAVIQPGDPIQLPLPECIDPEATADPDRTRSATPRPAPTDTPAGPAGSQVHIVQPGDVLVNIAAQYGVTVNAIVQANNLTNPNALQVGQQLIIPPSS
ncbi:MAG TPA: LysM peptidoglycan-binding domain-containing protein [Candidatus Limnocylindrales bacterium]|nr:LysM peptidoglycan-binding domain-containing protein [Candidatus Limnocylindrales bacterium]